MKTHQKMIFYPYTPIIISLLVMFAHLIIFVRELPANWLILLASIATAISALLGSVLWIGGWLLTSENKREFEFYSPLYPYIESKKFVEDIYNIIMAILVASSIVMFLLTDQPQNILGAWLASVIVEIGGAIGGVLWLGAINRQNNWREKKKREEKEVS